jgi:hypothetical protein
MEIMVQLPEDVAKHLAARWQDLPHAALESLAIEGCWLGALTQQGSASVSRRISLRPFILSHRQRGEGRRIQPRGVV